MFCKYFNASLLLFIFLSNVLALDIAQSSFWSRGGEPKGLYYKEGNEAKYYKHYRSGTAHI